MAGNRQGVAVGAPGDVRGVEVGPKAPIRHRYRIGMGRVYTSGILA